MNKRIIAAILAAGSGVIAAPAMAEDLLLSKTDATVLIESDVGKPYWQMEAQCAGMFGAAFAYASDHHRTADAERSKDTGISMLNDAVARLQMDRGLDQPSALNLAAVEVETGRAAANTALQKQGDGPDSAFNFMRSACYDIAAAQRRHVSASR